MKYPVIHPASAILRSRVTQLMQKVNITCVIIPLLLLSCNPGSLIQRKPLSGEAGTEPPVRYSILFIIHGDGDYLYHDSGGQARRADVEAFAAATRVAEQNLQAEVFIFHERRRRHRLLFLPQRDGKFFYYRHGRLLAKESYWRDQGSSRFDPLVERFNLFRAHEEEGPVKMFIYFGHEIPEFDGTGYDASYKNRRFTVDELATGLERVTLDSSVFDLAVLSTCFTGTPNTIAALSPYARTIVASPDNLHLSYFDLDPFERLDIGLQDGDISAFAENFARHAFDRLTDEIQTAVSVAVYDVARVQPYLHSVSSEYSRTLTALRKQKPEFLEHCDCAEDASYLTREMGEGVNIFYRSPGFGRSKHKPDHTGWECWRLRQ